MKPPIKLALVLLNGTLRARRKLIQFSEFYENIEKGTFLEESRRRSFVLGKQITVHTAEGTYEAKAVDLNEEGHLIIEKDGQKECLYTGEITIRVLNAERAIPNL